MIVKYNLLGVHNADGVILKPGVNQITDVAAWKKARKHPMVAKAIENGDIEEVSEVDEKTGDLNPEGPSDESILTAMKIPQAKVTVEQTTDISLLKQWKKTEKRNQVIGAINAQIEKMEAPPEERGATRGVDTGKGFVEIKAHNPQDAKDAASKDDEE